MQGLKLIHVSKSETTGMHYVTLSYIIINYDV